ncbi:ribosome small subunit-dependent GTPase A [Engelhardtia mirabilis]|uniref:Small ribosomal subunit biogenesis GTPase RsgA n=1 Tax=Engelhardtia mirabilis TaxID=2528011 RepID=A0A518BIE1_9BACT|nr:Putative ribosome biogenesis GTPase RsgA [Planctomycetes bacterium Pla133]QDV01075.1 Putative ribosome biogenesis GTPase RsgA [Planctomycetes bacterium Pla86]
MTPEEKDETRRRAMANFDRAVSLDEQKQRKQRAKERKARRSGDEPRARERVRDEDDWDELEDFQPMGSSRKGPLAPRVSSTTVAAGPPDTPGALDGTVIAVARDGARVVCGSQTLKVPMRREEDLAVGDRARVIPLTTELARLVGRHERRTELARADPTMPGRRRVLAANVDLALVVLSVVGPPFKPGLFDRFQVALIAGGIEPRMVVNKVDLLADEDARAELEARLAPYREAGVRVHLVSASAGLGLDELIREIAGRTIVAVGHSGVGKSSLLNALDPEGAERVTSQVRESDGKGRHTTTSSELRRLSNGTVLIDTPGIRALGLATEQLAALDEAFPEVSALAADCRFGDCRHDSEPDCAVRAALESGELDRARWDAYRRMGAG